MKVLNTWLSRDEVCEIGKKMFSLYFGFAVFCLFEVRVPELDTQPLPPDSCGRI
jgi:hypothetical protein